MSRTVTPVIQNDGVSPGADRAQTQTRGNDFSMNIGDLRGKLDELLRGAGFPPDDDRVQGFMTQLENADGTQATDQYGQPLDVIEYRQPSEFQPGRSEHPSAPAIISQPVSDAVIQPWTQCPSRPQSSVSSQELHPLLPTMMNQNQGLLPPVDGAGRPMQTTPFQHRGHLSLGTLNLGQSAPAYSMASRNQRAATLPGQLSIPDAHLRFWSTTEAMGNLSAIAEAGGSASRLLTLAPDDAVSKHQAVYRNQPTMTQELLPPKQTSDNINQTVWHLNAPQHVLEPPTGPRAGFQATPQAGAAFHPSATGPAAAQVIERKPLNPRPAEFRPMQAVLDPTLREHLKQQMAAANAEDAGVRNKFSTRYYGMHTEGNASADHLTNEQNCALWLRNLPPDVTHKELLHSIRGIGRIWCTYINQPDFVHHNTAAAKVAFFTPAAARQYLAHVEATGPTIRGFRVKADYNRIKYPEKPIAGGLTRVLIITGSSWFVNPENLCRYFAELFTFQVDEVIELVTIEDRSVVEFRFGSYRCQAQMGKMALDRQRPEGLEVVEFGEDPCETGETFISYRIAADRISKKTLLSA